MMLNKFEEYQRVSIMTTTNMMRSNAGIGCSADLMTTNSSTAVAAGAAECESIHSGQFMVSHFEAEEAQDDLLDDDGEIKMLDPEDPSLSKPEDQPGPCMELQLYVPRKVTQQQNDDGSAPELITSHLEIETSLTKLFKCMSLAYSQKLTSPKWNHFKGVRLRWKDKIRLNNVIWRCWHMQFILKRKTPVCQFASPLDVDIHSNPQAVVLEGKYWKRQLAVIKAEYRKWRKNYKSKATGCLIYDTKSEFDFLEWSPLNDRSLMLSEDWTSDTLFSAINVPFPFPDPREIARGAGIADFIQPSLGPLQPNLDDIDLTFAELLQNARLPPVPEEGTEEMLKNVAYGYPSIMGTEQMDSNSIMDVNTNNSNQMQMNNHDDANMLELNTPLNSMQYADIEQQFAVRQTPTTGNITLVSGQTTANAMSTQSDQRLAPGLLSDSTNTTNSRMQSAKLYNNVSAESNVGRQSTVDFPGKSVIKGRITKSSQRPFRREPHNYDKAQPTLHQTSIYQQMLAEQQKNQQTHHQQLLQANINNTNALQQQVNAFQSQQPQQMHYPQQNSQFSQSPPTLGNFRYNSEITNSSNSNNNSNLLNSMHANMSNVQLTQSGMTNTSTPPMMLNVNVKIEPHSSESHTMFDMSNSNDVYSNNSNSYKPYPTSFKKSLSAASYIMSNKSYMPDTDSQIGARHIHAQSLPMTFGQNTSLQDTLQQRIQHPHAQLSPTSQQQQQQHNQLQQQTAQNQQITQVAMPKEMFRSNSLPLNVCVQKLPHDTFAVPKYHAKSNRTRTRSNSIHQHAPISTQKLQSATSDPMLNSTLAQLLTSNSRISLGKQQSVSTSAITNLSMPMTTASSSMQGQTVTAPSFFMNMPHTSTSSSSQQLHTNICTQEVLHKNQQAQKQQQKSPKKSPTLPSTPLMQNSTSSTMLSYPTPAVSNNAPQLLSLSPETFHDSDSPLSPTQHKYPRDNQRRAGHIHAEQKRRYNIKNGFDMLHSLIPQLQENPNAKLSKAAMLQKGADHIKHLRSERNLLKDKMDALKKERDTLNNSLMHLHSILPANGAPVTRQGTEHVRQLYEQYVKYNTMNNWKFWILGLILEPLLASYTASVSSASVEELRRTAFLWVDQHCSLIDLRPAVSNKLKYLSMKTDILSDPPSTLQDEIVKAVNNPIGQHPNLHGP